jgi:phage regulator Rha-like protein
MAGNELIKIDEIKSRIFTIRGMQVMLDSDLAELYGVETKRLNEQVRRNIERFPEQFCFKLTEDESEILKSQNATSSWGGRRTSPFVFSEHGVAMVATVLKSNIAIKISIEIIKAFVFMRKVLSDRSNVFNRLEFLEIKQIETDRRLNEVFKAMESDQLPPKQGVLFDGQVFEAHKFVSDIVRSAEKSIILIDNYVDDTVLTLFSKRKQGVMLKIFTKNLSKQLVLDTQKFHEQFPPAEIKEFNHSHDRFLIIDDKDLYHFGASLKDLGKKWFGFSKMDIEVTKMLARI